MAAKRTRRNSSTDKSTPTADALWVSSKVKTRFSKFKTTKVVMDLITKYTFRTDNQDAYVDIVP